MKPLTLEYIAGFVDGEGSFTIGKHKGEWYQPFFSIANTNLRILRDIREFFSLRVKMRTKHRKNPKWKTCYHLRTSSIDQAKSISELLLPYLRIKQEQAEIITQFPRSNPIYTQHGPLTDYSTKALREELYKRILDLNKTGPAAQESNRDPQEEPDPQLGLFHNNQRR